MGARDRCGIELRLLRSTSSRYPALDSCSERICSSRATFLRRRIAGAEPDDDSSCPPSSFKLIRALRDLKLLPQLLWTRMACCLRTSFQLSSFAGDQPGRIDLVPDLRSFFHMSKLALTTSTTSFTVLAEGVVES